MPSIYCASRSGQEPITDVDSVDAIEAVVRTGDPGRYHVDEISSDPLPSGHMYRRWGVGLKRNGGTVAIKPDRWPES